MMGGPVLVTGANGFVGSALVRHLCSLGIEVRAAVRQTVAVANPAQPGLTVHSGLSLGEDAGWGAALTGVEAVVHCAARVHVMNEQAGDALSEFRRINVAGTLQLAKEAVRAGVRRFVFVSSIGVHGAQTHDRAFRADDEPAPHSPYARSKLEAELALRALVADTDMTLCIVRPPMVYGPRAPGNFAALLNALRRGLPLPLGRVHNRRSFVAVENLVDLLSICTHHPLARDQVFLVSDGDDLSTTELVRCMARGVGRKAFLVPMPDGLLRWVLHKIGKGHLVESLLGSLEVDIGHTRERLRWTPVVHAAQALESACRSHAGLADPNRNTARPNGLNDPG